MIDKGAVVFYNQQEANEFCRLNWDFEPTSLHPNWMGKIKCRYCRVTGWVKDVHANKNWTNKHGANCKKRMGRPITWVPAGQGTINVNFLSGGSYSTSATTGSIFAYPHNTTTATLSYQITNSKI